MEYKIMLLLKKILASTFIIYIVIFSIISYNVNYVKFQQYIGLIILLLFLFIYLLTRNKIVVNKIFILLFLYPLINLPAYIYCYNTKMLFQGVYSHLQYALLYLFGINIIKSNKEKRILLLLFLFFNLYLAVFYNEITLGRYSGVTGNANQFGITMVICIIFAFYVYNTVKNKIMKLILIVITISFVSFLLLSESRQSIFGLLISIFTVLFYLFIKNRKKMSGNFFKTSIIFFVIIFFILAINSYKLVRGDERFTSNNIEDSAEYRFELVKAGIAVFEKYPIWGAGLFNYSDAILRIYPIPLFAGYAHNDYIQVLSTTGIIGVIVYILLYLEIFKFIKLYKGYKKIALILFLIFILFDNFFKPNLSNKLFYISLFILTGSADEKNNINN